jgi:cytidine deaminase
MAIEYITPDLVSINGCLVEIRDSREPDVFDLIADEVNQELQERFAGPIEDIGFAIHPSILSLAEIGLKHSVYQQIPRFIDLARRAAEEHGVSYRDFKVGASAYVVSADGSQGAYLFGANNTPFEGARRDCAEMDILEKAKAYDHIVALAIYGPSDDPTVNALPTNTLHPCSTCRQLLETSPQVDDETLMITSNPDGAIELMFVKDLIQQLHNGYNPPITP